MVLGEWSPERMAQRAAAIAEAAKGQLSPERYAELIQATDPKYSPINRVVARYELPRTVVPQVFAVQEDIQQRAAALRQSSDPGRATKIQELVGEAKSKLAPLLGGQAFETYMTDAAQWMQQLDAPAAPAGAKKE